MKRQLPITLAILLTGMVASPATAADSSVAVSVPGNQPWTNSGFSLKAGDSVSIRASGTIFIAGSDPGKSPAGAPGCIAAPGNSFLVPGLRCYSLIGRVGNQPAFEVGTEVTFTAPSPGELFLGVDDNFFGDNSGAWTAAVAVTSHPVKKRLGPPSKAQIQKFGKVLWEIADNGNTICEAARCKFIRPAVSKMIGYISRAKTIADWGLITYQGVVWYNDLEAFATAAKGHKQGTPYSPQQKKIGKKLINDTETMQKTVIDAVPELGLWFHVPPPVK